ncbi:MAG: LuxR C-terminal-related transcriptional regulator [Chloroflexota bacterium]|nr:LuxR C-terminal-related transcriptional regulator [Chloroflexota bacterium]
MNRELSHPTSNLLRTKLLVPPIPGRVIARPRLLDQLADGLACRLILVAAPAGFGKTTALGQWLAGSGIDTAWVSLDQRDNDPTRFWAYVVAALQTRRPDVGATALSMLQAPHPPPWETILTELLNDLVAIREDVVLLLDDYHVVENRDIHEGVVFAVENLPPPQETLEAAEAGLPEEVSQPVIEPLTERELEVLEELSRGLTNPEIAERLMVSLNTVKTHTRNIYGKLGVRNRTEAVVRAQELGLLEA